MFEPTSQAFKAKIMIVDDIPEIVTMLSRMLKKRGYEVSAYHNGASALEAAEIDPPDLILLDILMPEMDGYQVCERIKQNPRLKDVPVIFISGLNLTESKVKAFHLGGVDYITKPFHLEEVEARVWTQIRLHVLQKNLLAQKLKEEKMRELTLAQQATIFALAKLAESRDEETGLHLERVREYCLLLAEQLRVNSAYSEKITPEFVETIYHAAPLHDLGKVAIADRILLKPDKLSPEEFETIKTHTVYGAENLQDVYNNYASNIFIGMGIEIALYHHERWDGRGYPDGLVGQNIPLSARIMAVADCYDALRSDRCYRKGFEHQQVRDMIMEESGTHFDPEICKAFVELEDEFARIMKQMV